MLGFVIQNHPHRSGANLGGKLVRRFARHGSTFSGVGASGKPGAVHGDASPVFDAAEEVFDFVSLAVEAFGAVGFLSGVAAARMTGKAPSSLICCRAFSLS
jgi:hypothetical protein